MVPYGKIRPSQIGGLLMKLLRVRASHFKNCADDFMIDLTPKARKSTEDIEYELQQVAPELYAFNTAAFIGKNASGKTTAIELLDCAYSILGDFRLEDKHYSYDDVLLEITFYHDGFIYRYDTKLSAGKTMRSQAVFRNEHIYRKTYYKTNVNDIYDDRDYA